MIFYFKINFEFIKYLKDEISDESFQIKNETQILILSHNFYLVQIKKKI